MRQCRFRAICIAIFILLFSLIGQGVVLGRAGEHPVTLFVFDRPPYYELQNGKPAGGFLLDMALDIFEIAGIPVDIQEMPATRILATFEAREISACGVGWLRLPEREAFAHFSLPFYINKPLGVVVRRKTARRLGPNPSLDTLLCADLAWGHRQHYSHGKILDAALHARHDLRVTRFTDLPPILRLIALGRLDATLLAPEEFAAQTASRPDLAANLVLLPIADAPPGFPRHIMCDAGMDPALMDRINAAITTYRQSERYQRRLRQACPLPAPAVR